MARLEEWLEDILEEGEDLGGNNTHRVVRHNDMVFKHFEADEGNVEDPSGYGYHFASQIPNFLDRNEAELTVEEQADRARYAARNQDEIGFRTADLVLDNGLVHGYEYLDHPSFQEFIDGALPEEIRTVSRDFGEMLGEVHGNGYALRDLHYDDILVDRENDELYVIDNEQLKIDANTVDTVFDQAKFLGHALLEPVEKSRAIRTGFREGYDGHVYMGATAAMFYGQKLLFNRDRDKLETGTRNLADEFI
ncbi:MAG: hypothetical protein ABEI58_04225 [Candidatus Nanohaloarchaea archaeon]